MKRSALFFLVRVLGVAAGCLVAVQIARAASCIVTAEDAGKCAEVSDPPCCPNICNFNCFLHPDGNYYKVITPPGFAGYYWCENSGGPTQKCDLEVDPWTGICAGNVLRYPGANCTGTPTQGYFEVRAPCTGFSNCV